MAKVEKLKLRAFKSFEKATIPFSEGFTTIVGPNGSGKSNLLDAMAFALGTARMSNLRANVLTDLIKKNSKKDTAEVELQVRDRGGEVHNISREINKEGASTFRLNGTRTTKHRISDLLSAMNVRPDGHNIIMQGDIDEFIRKTPIQRRKVIDEVSGIAEYDEKKEKSLKKLEAVQKKVDQAEIIHSERQGRVKALKEEKKEAEEYQELRKQLKRHEATLLQKQLDHLQTKYQEALDGVAKNKDQVEELEKQRQQKKELLKEKQEEIDAIEQEIMERSGEKQKGIRKEIQDLKSEMSVIEERINQKRRSINENRDKVNELNQEISRIGNKVSEKEDQLDKVETDEQEALKELNKKQSEFKKIKEESGDLRKKIEQTQEKIEQLNEEINQLTEEIHQNKSQIQTAHEKIKMKEKALQELDSGTGYAEKHQKIKQVIEEKKKNTQKLSEELEEKRKRLEEKKNTLTKKKEQQEKKKEQLENKQKEHNKITSEIKVVKENKDKGKIVQKLREKEQKGIIGTLNEVITYPTKYAASIENLAGERLNYILTKDRESALNAVKTLKKEKIGKASFIPIKDLEEVHLLEKKPQTKGFIDFARNLVQTNKEYEDAVNTLLGNTIVAEDTESLKDIKNTDSKIATLEGDLLEKTGIIRGGYDKEAITKEKIDKKEKLDQEISEIEKQLQENKKETKKKEEELEQLREETHDLNIEIKGNKATIKNLEERAEEYRLMKTDDEKKTDQLKEEIEQIKKKKEELEKKEEEIEQKNSIKLQERKEEKEKLSQPKIKETKERLEKLREEIDELKEKRTNLRTQKEKLSFELNKGLIEKRKELKKGLEKLNEEHDKQEEEQEELRKKRNALTRTLKEKEEEAREKASDLGDLFKVKEGKEKKKRQIEEELTEINEQVNELKEEVSNLKIKKAQMETEKNTLQREYEKYKDITKLEKTKKDLKERLTEIEERLEKIGDVNLKAIEQYKEEKEQLEDIEIRKDELTQEKIAIEEMIEELENKKEETFLEAFNTLNENFSRRFKELYTEENSEAEIELEEEDKPLETGLLIEAKPAGKSIKNIDAMSGGEKTLTALAFLFAIQDYKPSPFYILDEVDVALDKENSERIAKMLKKTSKDVQFVVVTHNSSITRESDQVIGVHMKEKEQSSVVEVNLHDYVETNS